LGYKIIDNYGQYKDMPLSICMSKQISGTEGSIDEEIDKSESM
jgi:hypothetical protein